MVSSHYWLQQLNMEDYEKTPALEGDEKKE